MKQGQIFVILALALTACNSDTVFEQKLNVSEAGWTAKDSLVYPFEIQDTTLFYEMMLDVDFKEGYRYQNLYVNIHTRFPDGKLEKDVVSLELGTPGGKWHGQCSGGECSVPVQLQQKFSFPQPGKYVISLHQFTRVDTIKELNTLTLSIQKSATE